MVDPSEGLEFRLARKHRRMSTCRTTECSDSQALSRGPRFRSRSSLLILVTSACCALAGPSALQAKPDFSRSSIQPSNSTPREGDVIEYVIHVRNSGDEPAVDTRVEVVCPSRGILIGTTWPVEVDIDNDPQSVRGSIDLPAGAEATLRLQVLAPRESNGDALSLSLRAAHYSSSTDHWDHHSMIVSRRADAPGVKLGGLRFEPAAFWLLGWMLTGFAVLVVLTFLNAAARNTTSDLAELSLVRGLWKRLPVAPTMLLMIPVAFWLIFGAMAWRDYRVLTAWKKTDATIVGRREVVETSTSTSTSSSSRSSSRRTTTSTTFTPDFALRYEVDGESIVSNGFDTGSSVRIGGRITGEQDYAKWTVGTVVPCWYDPSDPRDVVVRRGPGGAYFFALLPLPIFCFGVYVVRKVVRTGYSR